MQMDNIALKTNQMSLNHIDSVEDMSGSETSGGDGAASSGLRNDLEDCSPARPCVVGVGHVAESHRVCGRHVVGRVGGATVSGETNI